MGTPSEVRVRFAPSPTGYLHVGGVRTLLLNWLYAKKSGGKIILRIEDTDQERSTPEAEVKMRDDIRALGLTFDEGPDEGGDAGPYRQSERIKIYQEFAEKLVAEGKAYYCFHTPEQITEMREAAIKMGQPPHILDEQIKPLLKEEVEDRLKKGERAGLRFRVPKRDMVLEDLVRGRIDFKAGSIGDFFITRSPRGHEKEIGRVGYPVYNFACAIDDALMKMTHVLRGEDHLTNTLKQLFLFEAMGFTPPKFAHIAMVLGADRQKLSKRNGDVSSKDYLEKGYLPEAIINFLSLLGWWPSSDLKPRSGHPEIIALDELISSFDLKGLQKSAAVFDTQKLNWMNGQYIKNMDIKELAKRAHPFFEKSNISLEGKTEAWFEQLLGVIRGEVQLMGQLPDAAQLFFDSRPELEEEGKAVLVNEEASNVVQRFRDKIKELSADITEDEVVPLQKGIGKETGTKGKGLFMPIRVAVTGKTHGPELKLILPLLGNQEILNRIDETLKKIT